MKRRRRNMTTIDYFRNNIKWFMLVMAIIFIAGIFVGPGFGSYGSLQCGKNKSGPRTQQEYEAQNNEIMAKMGDKKFTSYEVYRDLNQRMSYYRENNPGAILPPEQEIGMVWSILDQKITQALKIKNAESSDIKITTAELNVAYDEQKKTIISNSGLAQTSPEGNESLLMKADRKIQAQKSERAFLSFLADRNLSPQALKEQLKENLLVQKYDEKLKEEAKEQVRAEAKKDATEIFNRIVSEGEDFDAIAKEESDDYASASKGGLVENKIRKDAKALDNDFAVTLFTAEIDKVLEPIELDDGFYVVKVTGRTLAEGEEYKKAKDGIIAELKEELDITDEEKKPEVVEYTEEELIDMATTEGVDKNESPAADTDQKNQITEDMIKERFEKVTYRQIFIRPENENTRYNENLEKMKDEAGIEIIDKLMKAYSHVAGYGDDMDFDSAIEGFRSIREDRLQTLAEAETELAKKTTDAENASEDEKIEKLEMESFYERRVAQLKSDVAQINYLVALYTQQKIDDINQKRTQEFLDLQRENPEEYADMTVPDASDEELAMFAEMRTGMRSLMEEAVANIAIPDPYYSALLGDLLLLDEDWDAAHENWAIVADYGSRNLALLQRADPAYNLFMDNLEGEDARIKAGTEFDKLQKDLDAALEIQKKQQAEWQAQMQKMMEEQMAQQEKGE
ncbi:MAG: peptidylprolyl isomerase [bacterium]